MDIEVEAKFLHVDHALLRAALQQAGGKLVHPMRLMKRVNMDFPDRRIEQKRGWLRIRDEGDKVTLAYKQVDSWDVNGMQEVETVVGDFEAARKVMEATGLVAKSYAETKRETWQIGAAEVVLDEWPWVDPFCEIEAAEEAQPQAAAAGARP